MNFHQCICNFLQLRQLGLHASDVYEQVDINNSLLFTMSIPKLRPTHTSAFEGWTLVMAGKGDKISDKSMGQWT